MKMKPKTNAAFLPLFALEVLHQYHDGGAYGSYSVKALGATQKVMQRFGWVDAQMENKFSVCADRSRAAATLKQAEDGQLNAPDLFFALQFRDPNFPKYTDLPMRTGHALSVVGGKAKSHISAKPQISADDLVPIQSRPFQIPVAAAGDLWLVNLSGEKLQQLPPPTQEMFRIDPAILELGLYGILAQEKTIYRFLLTQNTFNSTSALYLTIPITMILNALRHHLENEGSPDQSLEDSASSEQLILPTRKTLWRYDFFNHGGNGARDYSLKLAATEKTPPDSSEGLTFRQVKGVLGPGGETSIGFQSLTPIPLTANRSEQLTLLRDGRTLIDQLPTPELEFSQAEESDSLCSNLFVYL